MRLEFKDGYREVPDYLANFMGTLETWQLTYAEAVKKVEWKLASDHLNNVQSAIIRQSLGGR
jgi:hypothetical protein